MPNKKVFGNDGPNKPDLPMSTFDKSFTNNMTARFGRLYPCFVDMVPAHSTAHITPHMAFDMMPTVSPIQATVRCHVSYYKVPLRILWKNYEDFFSRVGNHKIPYIKRPAGWCETGSLADYMGIPSQDFRRHRMDSGLNFRRAGYILTDYMRGEIPDAVEQDFHLLFHSTVVNRATLNLPLGSDEHVMYTPVAHQLYDGLVVLPYNFAGTRTNQDFGSYTLRLLAVRVSAGEQMPVHFDVGLDAEYGFDTLRDIPAGYIMQKLNGNLVHDNSPASGTSYPYGDVAPGSFAFVNQAKVMHTVYGDYNRYNFVFRLSDQFLVGLNEMIDKCEKGQKVYLLLSWSTYSASEDLFGTDNDIPGTVPVLSAGANTVGFTEAIESGEKPNSTTLRDVSQLILPKVGLGSGGFCHYAVVGQSSDENPFCSYEGENPKLPINAFAFRAYEFVYNYFFRNERVDPFIKDGEPSYNQFLTNDGDGADETTPVDFFNAPYEYDMFTRCMKSPQFGNAPLVGVSTNDEGDTAEILMRGQRVRDDGSLEPFDYTIAMRMDPADKRIIQITNYDEIADQPSVVRLNEAIRYGISINDFRNVNAFQIMNERFMKAGYCYPDLVEEFFGVRPPVGENYPEYLGGISRTVSIGKVENLALSESAQLGQFAGKGSVEGHGERVECFTADAWSIIIGLCWFSVTPIYTQKLDKHFMYSSYLDFYNPALMSIGPQPVFKNQLAPLQLPRKSDGTIDESHIADVFGYNRPWAEMVSREDEAHGEFRSSMYNYLLQRYFAQVPDLGEDFLYIDSSDLTDVFTYMVDTDKFFGAIRHEYFLKMPMPKVSLPRII